MGRKAWLFVGGEDHATTTLFSRIASCNVHDLVPEFTLRDLFRVLVRWPRDHYLELTPCHWAATRAGFDPRDREPPLKRPSVPERPAEKPAAG